MTSDIDRIAFLGLIYSKEGAPGFCHGGSKAPCAAFKICVKTEIYTTLQRVFKASLLKRSSLILPLWSCRCVGAR